MHQKEGATLSVTSQPDLESYSVKGSRNRAVERAKGCAGNTRAGRHSKQMLKMHKNKTQTHPVGFVTALTLTAPIEHATLQCY